MSNISETIDSLLKAKGLSTRAFEQKIGCSNGVIARCIAKGSDISSQWVSKIIEIYPDINPFWLLTGQGEMFKQESNANQALVKPIENTQSSHYKAGRLDQYTPGAIPLVPAQAVGGLSGSDFSISDDDVIGYYVIPGFQNKGIDFMIRITGDSMAPRLWGGDIIACSIIRNSNFIQWNKTHLIATRDQGLLVKRLRKSTDPDCILAVSNNPDYDPFDIPKQDILGIARVVGVIHLE